MLRNHLRLTALIVRLTVRAYLVGIGLLPCTDTLSPSRLDFGTMFSLVLSALALPCGATKFAAFIATNLRVGRWRLERLPALNASMLIDAGGSRGLRDVLGVRHFQVALAAKRYEIVRR